MQSVGVIGFGRHVRGTKGCNAMTGKGGWEERRLWKGFAKKGRKAWEEYLRIVG